ncbi:MAG TPA: hypothetical protein VF668_07290 [Pyrinomonadaceae bacterium]
MRRDVTEEQLEFVKVGFVFSGALTILCAAAAPDPLGPELFSALGIYPLGLGFVVWPAVGYLLAGARSDFASASCLTAVTSYNYWVAGRLTASDAGDFSLLGRLWAGNKLGLAVLAALYVGGQLAVVLPQARGRRGRRRPAARGGV